MGFDSSRAAAWTQQVMGAGCSPTLTPPWCPGLCSGVFAQLVTHLAGWILGTDTELCPAFPILAFPSKAGEIFLLGNAGIFCVRYEEEREGKGRGEVARGISPLPYHTPLGACTL